MKQVKRNIASLIVMFFAVLFLPTAAFAAEQDGDATSYYDIVDTPEWAEMSRLDRLNACQLSKEELQSMSTDELLCAALDFPFFIDVLAFSTYRQGFVHVLSENTALQELMNREDGGEALIGRYAEIDVSAPASVEGEDSNFSDMWKLEIVLAQPEVADIMSEQQIARILEIAEEKYEEKSADSEYGHLTGLFYESVNENSEVTEYSYNAFVTIPMGSRVPVIGWQPFDGDFSNDKKQELAKGLKKNYPNVILLRDVAIARGELDMLMKR